MREVKHEQVACRGCGTSMLGGIQRLSANTSKLELGSYFQFISAFSGGLDQVTSRGSISPNYSVKFTRLKEQTFKNFLIEINISHIS